MEQYIDRYVEYLRNIKKSSENTIASYKRDLLKFVGYFQSKDLERLEDITETYITSYVLDMEWNVDGYSVTQHCVHQVFLCFSAS